MKIEDFKIEYIKSYMIAPNIKHLIFKRTDDKLLKFIPGQFITFFFNDNLGKIKRRSYSIATINLNKNIIEFAISYIKGGIASEIFFNIKLGDQFNVRGPAGKLILKPEEKIRKLILVGTSTGISPYRTMLSQLKKLITHSIGKVYLLLGVKFQCNKIYNEEFYQYMKENHHFYFRVCLSRQKKNLQDYEVHGYVQDYFKKLGLDPKHDVVYLCGNPNMINQAFMMLINMGFNSQSVRREKYISSH